MCGRSRPKILDLRFQISFPVTVEINFSVKRNQVWVQQGNGVAHANTKHKAPSTRLQAGGSPAALSREISLRPASRWPGDRGKTALGARRTEPAAANPPRPNRSPGSAATAASPAAGTVDPRGTSVPGGGSNWRAGGPGNLRKPK